MPLWCLLSVCTIIAECRLGNRDVAPGGDVMWWYLVAALQFRPRERQIYVVVLAPGAPCKFGTRDLHLLLSVSKYVTN